MQHILSSGKQTLRGKGKVMVAGQIAIHRCAQAKALNIAGLVQRGQVGHKGAALFFRRIAGGDAKQRVPQLQCPGRIDAGTFLQDSNLKIFLHTSPLFGLNRHKGGEMSRVSLNHGQ